MAAVPKEILEENEKRPSTERKGPTSHGRGGAGNIGTTPSDFEKPTLETPTIKSQIYTTGRGGSGNMAKNDDPEEARRAQDVTAHPRRESNNSTHVGRGGAANIFKAHSKEEIEKLKKEGKWESAVAGDDKGGKEEKKNGNGGLKGLADKGKELLFGKKNGEEKK